MASKETQQQRPAKPLPKNSKEITLENGETVLAVKEGLATILSRKRNDVFYNPIQNFNRDLSVLAIKAFGEKFLAEKRERTELKKERKQKTKNAAKQAVVEDTEEPKLVNNGKGKPVNPEELPPMEPPAMETQGTSELADATQSSLPSSTGSQHQTRTKRFAVLDALSATGLRALRYALEIPFCTSITANDLSPSAVQLIQQNIEYNKLQDKITTSASNAIIHMYASPQKYDMIDLDPYGTAAPFIDSALQALSDGGMLAVTCTDAGVWASTGYSEKCFALYGGLPVKGEYCHEAGLRLILHSIAMAAAKYGLSIEPLLSLSIDFYARVFVRIKKSPADVKFVSSRSMTVYCCDSGGCGEFITNRIGKATEEPNKSGRGTFWKYGRERLAPELGPNGKCPSCHGTLHMAGPMYAGPLHNPEFIQSILKTLPDLDQEVYATVPRIEGMLELAASELEAPFYFDPAKLAKILHVEAPAHANIRGALLNLGYKVSRTHVKATVIKTDAPWSVIWQIMREWRKKCRPDGDISNISATSPSFRVIHNDVRAEDVRGGLPTGQKEGKIEVVFDSELGKTAEKRKGVVMYQVNPTDNWGPMARAGKRKNEGDEEDKPKEAKRTKE